MFGLDLSIAIAVIFLATFVLIEIIFVIREAKFTSSYYKHLETTRHDEQNEKDERSILSNK